MNHGKPNDMLDRSAIALSGLCLLHCLALPFALLLGPLLGTWLSESETQVHWVLLGLAIPISGVALWRGFARHRNMLTMLLGTSGLVLMFLGASHLLGESLEIGLTVTGVSILLIAHVRNMMGHAKHA